jgi:hypothetical protein
VVDGSPARSLIMPMHVSYLGYVARAGAAGRPGIVDPNLPVPCVGESSQRGSAILDDTGPILPSYSRQGDRTID